MEGLGESKVRSTNSHYDIIGQILPLPQPPPPPFSFMYINAKNFKSHHQQQNTKAH